MVSSVHSKPALPHEAVTASFVADPPQQAHLVQFYEEPDALFETVARFLSGGLDSGDRVLVIATAAHRDSIRARLDPAIVSRALAAEQITLLDAHETLGEIMVGETVEAALFHGLLERVVAGLRARAPNARVRAYGEMVDVLWHTGRPSAALRLEELWGEASQRHDLSLLCAYAMGHFDDESDPAGFAGLCDRHTHVIRSDQGPPSAAESVPSLREYDTVEQRILSLEAELRHRKGLEAALRQALRERSRVEAELRESVHREREARTKAEENDAFKEQFLAILGHDLRNPLNTILTTSRLMIMRGELSPESAKRLDRVIASGVRMQRMIEQILDVTSDRLDDGIHVALDPAQDVAALASPIVDELRAAHPNRKIELVVDGPCVATVDGARLEQVLRNLLGNAIAHGDAEKPVHVGIAARANETLTIDVHNAGPPIDHDERALLFEPFKRSRKSKGRSEGLGLGLYISQRIVNAHGGTLEVDSSADGGTNFRVTLPRTWQ